MTKTINLTTLPSGLRVVTDYVAAVESVAVGVWAGVGARHEAAEVNGVAHMVEHMMFKGTPNRNAQQIAEQIESVGGHMNAYTSREITSYHIHLLKDDLPLALDVLSDMYINSTLPEDELAKERYVILQEIGMSHDTPDDLVFDHYYAASYADQAVGRPILGPASIIKDIQRDSLQAHINTHYTAQNSVIVASGNVDHDSFVRQVEDKFAALAIGESKSPTAAIYTGGEKREEKSDLEQAHIILGFDAVSRNADDYYDVKALATIMGGGMSSRLFQEVREKSGLAYSVFAFYQAMQDGGQFGIYTGTGENDVQELIPVLCAEVLKAQHNITETEITRTRAQMKSGLLISHESMMTRADQQAKSILFKNKTFDQTAIAQKIDAITVETVKKAATKIFSSTPTIAAIGPLGKLEDYNAVKARLAG